MSVHKPNERIIAPGNQPDTHIERRHGVRTRRQLVQEQRSAIRRVPQSVVAVGNGTIIYGRRIRNVNFTGAGVVVTVLGDTATVTIA